MFIFIYLFVLFYFIFFSFFFLFCFIFVVDIKCICTRPVLGFETDNYFLFLVVACVGEKEIVRCKPVGLCSTLCQFLLHI